MHLTIKQLQTFSQEKIERIQNLRFKATCRYMLPNTIFYSKIFKDYGIDPFTLNKIEDWHKKGLPLIKKATYMKNPRDFIVQAKPETLAKNHFLYLDNQNEFGKAIHYLFDKEKILKENYMPHDLIFSGGTESGNPTPVFLTKAQDQTLNEILKIIGEILIKDFKGQTTGMNLFPYAPHLGWHAVHKALDLNADLNLNTAAGGAIPTERLVDMADKLKPNILCGMSTYLKNRWLPVAINKKITLPEKVLFINGAQKMYDAEREQIKQLMQKIGVKEPVVIDFYGASELKEAILPECKPGTGFHHIAPLSTIIKTVTVNKADEELITDWDFSENGYATSWNINGAGTILAGYLLGDNYDKIIHEKCTSCGLNVTRIFGINRISEIQAQLKITGTVEEKIKGTRVNLVAYREKALNMGAKEAQVYLKRKTGKIQINVIADAKTKKEIEKYFATQEIKPEIKTMKQEKQEQLKYKPIIIE